MVFTLTLNIFVKGLAERLDGILAAQNFFAQSRIDKDVAIVTAVRLKSE